MIDQRPKNPPTGLTSSYIKGQRGVILTWNDDSVGATGYEVKVDPAVSGANLTNILGFTDNAGVKKKRLEVWGTRGSDRVGFLRDYTFKVWAVNGAIRAELPATWVTGLDWPEHYWGHQEDHVVAWVEITGNAVIEQAIPRAVDEWEKHIGSIASLAFCMESEDSCNGDNGTNRDKGVATIKSVNKQNKSTAETGFGNDLTIGCGKYAACVKKIGTGRDSIGPGKHMTNMHVVFEDPPWRYDEFYDPLLGRNRLMHRKFIWTALKRLDGDYDRRRDAHYHYIDPTMVHELGHTLGLPDFYKSTSLFGTMGIMNATTKESVITGEDQAQLRAIYNQHNSSSH